MRLLTLACQKYDMQCGLHTGSDIAREDAQVCIPLHACLCACMVNQDILLVNQDMLLVNQDMLLVNQDILVKL